MADYALTLSDAELARYRFMATAAERSEDDLWRSAGIGPGAVVADVGCGPGAVAAVIAARVAPTGRVEAVDQDAGALAAARSAAEELATGTMTCRQGDATGTGLEPGAFDVVMVRHVLAHNGGREQAIVDHLATLLRPGGCVYLVDIDASAIRVRPSIPDFDDLSVRYQELHRRRGNDLSIGLRLAELLEAAGLDTVEFRGWYEIAAVAPGMRPPSWAARNAMVEAGIADQADLARWSATFDAVDAGDIRPTLYAPLFCAIGRRPA